MPNIALKAALAALGTPKASGVPGKNLFNKATAVIGSYMGDNGIPAVSATFDYSALIPVTPGVTYYGRGVGANMRFTTYYDAAGVRVAGGSNTAVSTFTVPIGVAFVRVTLNHTDLNTFQLEVGSAATAFEAYTEKVFLDPAVLRPRSVPGATLVDKSVTPDKVAFLVQGKNLFNKSSARIGFYLGNNGEAPVASATYDYSDFIAVTAGQPYYGRGSTRGMRFVAYYDADRTPVLGGPQDGGIPGLLTFTPPAGVAFARVTIYHGDLATFQLEAGAAATPFETYSLYLLGQDGTPINVYSLAAGAVSALQLAAGAVTPIKTSFLIPGKNLFNKALATTGYFLGHDNSLSANATFDYSDYMAVTPGQTYYGRGGGHGMRFTTFYDANKAFVAGGSSGEVNSTVIPAGVYFVRVTIYHADLDTFQFEKSAVQTAFEAYGWKFTSDIIGGSTSSAPLSNWSGKTWATLGDSITAGMTWQAMTANALGLIVTGFGIGGTKVSGPAGDANAMCQDTRINAIATTFDLVTMMGGTNDWAQNVPLGAENSTDPLTFNGALNTFAAKAFARWPSKRIALATTPYGEIPDWTGRAGWTSPAHNSLGLTTNDYAAAIRKACERLNLHCIDVARSGGWGTYNITEAMGGSRTDHLHPAAASLAAKGIAAAHRGGLRAIEPVA